MTEQERIEFLKQNSPYALPDNPSSSGWSASQIKRMYYKGLLALLNFLKEDKTELDGDIEELVNDLANEVTTRGTEDARVLGDAEDYTDTKVSGLKDISTLIYTDLSTSSILGQFIAKGTNPYIAILSGVPYLIKCTNASGMINLIATSHNDCYYGTNISTLPFSSLTHKTYATDSDISTLNSTKENVANKKTDLSSNSDTYYATVKAIQTALDSLKQTIENAQAVVDGGQNTRMGTIEASISSIISSLVNYLKNSGNQVLDGNFHITGNLVVDGETQTQDVETLQVADKFIVTNFNGAEISESGIVIKISSDEEDNAYAVIYDLQHDTLKIGLGTYDDGEFSSTSMVSIATRTDSSAWDDEDIPQWDSSSVGFKSSGLTITELQTLKSELTTLQNNLTAMENTFPYTISKIEKSDDEYSVTTEQKLGRLNAFSGMITNLASALEYIVDELTATITAYSKIEAFEGAYSMTLEEYEALETKEDVYYFVYEE